MARRPCHAHVTDAGYEPAGRSVGRGALAPLAFFGRLVEAVLGAWGHRPGAAEPQPFELRGGRPSGHKVKQTPSMLQPLTI